MQMSEEIEQKTSKPFVAKHQATECMHVPRQWHIVLNVACDYTWYNEETLTDAASEHSNIIDFGDSVRSLIYWWRLKALWSTDEAILALIVNGQVGQWRPEVETVVHLLLVPIQPA